MLRCFLLVTLTTVAHVTFVATSSCSGCVGEACAVSREVDVMFIIDWSKSSITEEELTEFYKEVVGNMDMEGNVEVGLSYFRKSTGVLLPLGSAAGTAEACAAIDSIPVMKLGDTFTHLALGQAGDMFREYGRSEACKVAVLVTDGGSDLKTKTTQAAAELQGLGVRMCVVQHGRGTETEMSNRELEVQTLVGEEGQQVRNGDDPDSILPLVGDTLGCINACRAKVPVVKKCAAPYDDVPNSKCQDVTEFPKCKCPKKGYYLRNLCGKEADIVCCTPCPADDLPIDDNLLNLVEGFRHELYVPTKGGKVIGNSGVTVGRGVDVGQTTKGELTKTLKDSGLKKADIDRIIGVVEPFFHPLKGQAALDKLNKVNAERKKAEKGPLALDKKKKDAERLSNAVKEKITDVIEKKYDAVAGKGEFAKLKCCQRTVILSVYYHLGHTNPAKTAGRFWKAVTTKDWKAAVHELRNFGKRHKHKRRRNQEADLLEGCCIK